MVAKKKKTESGLDVRTIGMNGGFCPGYARVEGPPALRACNTCAYHAGCRQAGDVFVNFDACTKEDGFEFVYATDNRGAWYRVAKGSKEQAFRAVLKEYSLVLREYKGYRIEPKAGEGFIAVDVKTGETPVGGVWGETVSEAQNMVDLYEKTRDSARVLHAMQFAMLLRSTRKQEAGVDVLAIITEPLRASEPNAMQVMVIRDGAVRTTVVLENSRVITGREPWAAGFVVVLLDEKNPVWKNYTFGVCTVDARLAASGLVDYTWGRFVALHTVGDYQVVEYERELDNGKSVKLYYHAYVRWEDTCHSFASLEEALVGAIAHAVEGPNHHADEYFVRMLGLCDRGATKHAFELRSLE